MSLAEQEDYQEILGQNTVSETKSGTIKIPFCGHISRADGPGIDLDKTYVAWKEVAAVQGRTIPAACYAHLAT